MTNEMSSSQPSDSIDCEMETDMDDSTQKPDQNVDGGKGTPQTQQTSTGINMEALQNAFEIQNRQLKAALDAEMDKRFPAQQISAPDSEVSFSLRMTGSLISKRKSSLNPVSLQTSYSLRSILPSSGSQHTHEAINVEELLQKHTALTHNCERLEIMNKVARQRIANLEAQIDKNSNLTAQIKAANEKNANLTQRMAALRQMLVPTSENQVIDSEIARRFCRIRSGIVSLVRQTWKPEIKTGTRTRDLCTEQLDLLRVDLTYDRLRAAVFWLINKDILCARPFFLGDHRKDIEKSLRKVEDHLYDNTSPGE